MSCDHFLGKSGLPWSGGGGRCCSTPWAVGALTRVRLHVLQQIVVELELDPTGATGVGFCGEK